MSCFGPMLKSPAGRSLPGLKPANRLKQVWVIGNWNLDIVCYLLFGAWDFLSLRNQLYKDIQFDF
jgi:hypothetical protein